jgi:hypothetical protein
VDPARPGGALLRRLVPLSAPEWTVEARDPTRVSFTWPFDSIRGSGDEGSVSDSALSFGTF